MRSLYKATLIGLSLIWTLSDCHPVPTQAPVATAVQTVQAFQPDQLIVSVKAGQKSRFLEQLQQRPGFEIKDSLTLASGEYLLLGFNPELLKQPSLLAQTTQASASASEALTRAIARDIRQQYAEYLISVDFNTLSEQEATSESVQNVFGLAQVASPGGLFNDLSFGIHSGLEGWWRTDTQVESSWNYSIGTGTVAAYLDQGFVKGHPELARRMILNGHNNQTSDYVGSQPDNIELPGGDHGTASLLVGFAERDNHIPSVGVAPNARFIPYVASSVWDASRALLRAIQDHPDVIGMNMALPIYPQWDPQGEFHQYQVLKDVFAQIASQTRIPVVVPAHNYGEPVKGGPRDWVPVAWASEYDNLIGVGGVQVQSGHQLKAWFSPDLVTGINARGSNYGAGMIWAPATALDIANALPYHYLPSSMNGTSAACPFMTGVVALIRSRVPELSPRQIRDVLLTTARAIPAADLMQQPGATVPMIQAQDALLAALHSVGKDPSRFLARKMQGTLHYAEGQHLFESEGQTWQVMPSLNNLLPGTPSEYDNQTLTVLAWTGIPPLQSQQIEILHIQDSQP